MGGGHEEAKQDEPIESSTEEKECKEVFEEVQRRKEIPILIRIDHNLTKDCNP